MGNSNYKSGISAFLIANVLTELFESETAFSFSPAYQRCIPCHIRPINYASLRPETPRSGIPQTMDC
jgi:hypothetical protein